MSSLFDILVMSEFLKYPFAQNWSQIEIPTLHMGLSSMLFWSKYKDPPTFMKCGINISKMLTHVLQLLMKLKIRICIF